MLFLGSSLDRIRAGTSGRSAGLPALRMGAKGRRHGIRRWDFSGALVRTLRRRSSSRFVFPLTLFLGFLGGLVLDACEIAENAGALFRFTTLAAKLLFEKLVEDLVELRAARHAERVEFTDGKSEMHGAPFLNVSPNF